MNGVGVEEAHRVSLADAEFLVLRVPVKLHREDVDRLREQIRSRLRTDVPVLVLEGGMELDVVRSGDWVYTSERPPAAPGRYEVAIALSNHKDVDLADWTGSFWLRSDGSGDRYDREGGPQPYAYRPAPVPPPVRRSGGDRAVSPCAPDCPCLTTQDDRGRIDLRDIKADELVIDDLFRKLYYARDSKRAVWVLTREQWARLRVLSYQHTFEVVAPPGGLGGDWTILGLPYVIEKSAEAAA